MKATENIETLKDEALEAGLRTGLLEYEVEDENVLLYVFAASEGESCSVIGYWWNLPLRNDDEAMEVAEKIRDLPLCVVRVDGEYGVALTTRSGWKTPWEVPEAYMRAGFLPPVSLAKKLLAPNDLIDHENAWVAAGCRRSLKVEIERLSSVLSNC